MDDLKVVRVGFGEPQPDAIFDMKMMTGAKLGKYKSLNLLKDIKPKKPFVMMDLDKGINRYQMYLVNQELEYLNQRIKDMRKSISPKRSRYPKRRGSMMKKLKASESLEKVRKVNRKKYSKSVFKESAKSTMNIA